MRGFRSNAIIGGSNFPKPIEETITASGDLNAYTTVRYENKVDLTKVSKIKFNYTIRAYFYDAYDGKDYYDSVAGICGVSVGNSGNFDKSVGTGNIWYGSVADGTWLTSNGVFELDVSDLSGEYYIGCGSVYNDTVHRNKNGQTTMAVTGVLFEK